MSRNIEQIGIDFSRRLRHRIDEIDKHNVVTIRDNVIIIKREYAHAPEDMVKYALELITTLYGKKYVIDPVDTGEVLTGKNPHRFIKFRLIQNEEMVTVHNMMSGKPVKIRAYDQGGCCDPSTETYWSM